MSFTTFSIHELDLAEYLENGRAVVRPSRGSESYDRYYPDRLSPLDCDCAVCRPMNYPPPLIGSGSTPVEVEGQLELWK